MISQFPNLRGEPIFPKIFFKPSPQRFISDYRSLKYFLTALGVFHSSYIGIQMRLPCERLHGDLLSINNYFIKDFNLFLGAVWERTGRGWALN